MKEKRTIKSIILIVSFCLMLAFPMQVSGDAKIDVTSATDIETGEILILTIIYIDNNLGAIKGQVRYDTKNLEYISGGDSYENTGLILVEGNGYGNGKAIFNIKFRAISSGEETIEVTTSELYNIEGNALGVPHTERTISITGETISSGGGTNDANGSLDGNKDDGDSNTINSNQNSLFSQTSIVYIAGLVGVILVLSITLVVINIVRKKAKKKKQAEKRKAAERRAEINKRKNSYDE